MKSIDRLREYVEVAPSTSVGGMARAILLGMIRAIEQEAMADRTAAYNEGYDAGFASADDWAAQHEDAMAEHGWVRLPVDAEGVPIHVGDVMAYEDNTKPMEVVALVPPAVFLTEDGPRYADMCRHHHAPTVEDVLMDLLADWAEQDERDGDMRDLVAEYAAKLRLAGEGE